LKKNPVKSIKEVIKNEEGYYSDFVPVVGCIGVGRVQDYLDL